MSDQDREVEPRHRDLLEPLESQNQWSSPEQLDQLMKIIVSMDWLILLTFGGLISAGGIWSIFGRIPVTVEGRGILIQPRQVIPFQANIAGQLQTLNVKVGECVQRNQVLATMEPTGAKQLKLLEEKKTQLENQFQDTFALSQQRTITEQQTIAASRLTLEQRLQDTLALTPSLRTREIEAQQQKRRSLEQKLENARSLLPVLKSRLDERHILSSQGAISKDATLEVQIDYTKSQEAIAEIEAELKQLELQTTQTEQQYLDNLNQVSQLQSQLRELDNKATQFDQQNLALKTQGDRELQEVNREIIRLKQQIEGNSQIISTQVGCIIELNASLGQVLESGTRLGYLQTTAEKPALKSLSYLAVKDGKRIKAGMTMIITPDTIQRERFGGIIGQVEKVATLPSTREGILAAIGNADVAQTLSSNGAVIEIEAALEQEQTTVSGYKWSSSQGVTDQITSGTTATVRITLEERAPITFVLPFLRELSGGN